MSCCADCTPYGLPQDEPAGYISTHGAYFSPSPNINAKDEHSERAILLLTDDLLENSRILADNLALRLDCDVWVPDYYQGHSSGPPLNIYPHRYLRNSAGANMSKCAWIKSKLRMTPRMPVFIKNRPTVIDARLFKFIKALQEEKDYSKIGAIGYCSGSSTAIRLASTEWIQSVVICHPSKFKLPEVMSIKVPSAWVCAEDKFFSKSLRLKAEAVFRRRKLTEKIDYEFQDYRGTTHGFLCRPDLRVSETREAYEKAFDQIVRWFFKTLPV
ncbi:dienelactone hydrolase endo-1,3,1,4-beta-D-glucanase [Lyophyllum atratum]|nr:dienelactone hydrolase endo-1,3,1,4-beta-D-glucanase [Lyophyllum atratum]